MAATAAHRDVERQRQLDSQWRPTHAPQDVLSARLRALAGAQRALEAGTDPDALYVLRQSLVDLAAVAVELANELPAPAT